PLIVMAFNDRTGVALAVIFMVNIWPLILAIPAILNYYDVSNKFIAILPKTKAIKLFDKAIAYACSFIALCISLFLLLVIISLLIKAF
ncbi:MAG: hypothetical protein ABL867_08230, partial [Rickettsiales bacterium]